VFPARRCKAIFTSTSRVGNGKPQLLR
jgi:hypothetical protein